ncbi:nucleotide sugar dehydrogenase [Agromyces sp. Root81]|uniref:nucleotide sugar dehydrogenase n=1 Tax=Agromyces sp. Root81 TaxID=1736601 RepID=UPI001910A45C
MIVGLGYVGLPLARAASTSGIDVTGLDLNERTVKDLNQGRSHIDDLSDADIAALLETGFTATTDASVIADADVVVICVPTPLDESGRPDLAAVIGATKAVAAHLTGGSTVVLESTTYPGTTTEILKPLLEANGMVCGRDFHLAFSPERIDPGNEHFTILNTPKVVGGVTPKCTERTVDFYSRFIEQVVTTKGPREAETAKLLENTYRHVNIALVNEMAQFCHAMGIDIWDVIGAAKTKPFGFQSFTPSAGVGGHCIPIDPNYLAYKVRADLDRPFRFVELAEEINQGMPVFVTRRLQDLLNESSLAMRGSTVLMLGVTYKPDISDRRESPAVPLARKLRALGCELQYHDPYVDGWTVDDEAVVRATDLESACAAADAVIIVQAHRAYRENPAAIVDSGTPTLDATGKFAGPTLERL